MHCVYYIWKHTLWEKTPTFIRVGWGHPRRYCLPPTSSSHGGALQKCQQATPQCEVVGWSEVIHTTARAPNATNLELERIWNFQIKFTTLMPPHTFNSVQALPINLHPCIHPPIFFHLLPNINMPTFYVPYCLQNLRSHRSLIFVKKGICQFNAPVSLFLGICFYSQVLCSFPKGFRWYIVCFSFPCSKMPHCRRDSAPGAVTGRGLSFRSQTSSAQPGF